MAQLDIVQGQSVQIPTIQLSDGGVFCGVVRAVQADTVALELKPGTVGTIPPKMDSNCVMTWKVDGVQRACPILVRSKSSRAMVVQVVIQERREAPRLRADVKLVYEIVALENINAVAEEVMAKLNPLGEPVSESARLLRTQDDPIEQIRLEIASLRGAMDTIMLKLDQLTTLLVSGERPRVAPVVKRPISIVNVSSTGLAFIGEEPYEQGQYMRLHLTLCTVPQVELDCMGVVVRSKVIEATPDEAAAVRYDIGIRYTHIHESDREHLIHYLFKVQRRILRDMKEARVEVR